MANFTKQAIETAFLQLLNEKPLNKISVRDIVEKCGINRNSFYYHFQDIPSLIAEIITACTDRLIEEYPTISTLDECCEMAVRYALRNRSAVMHIYHSVNRDLFEKSTMRLCEYAVTTYIDTAFPQHQLPEADRKAVIRFIKCQIFGMCIDWISDGMQDEALVIFLIIKAINRFHKKKEEAPAPEAPKGPTSEELLTEIRDLLKEKNQ